MIIKAKNNRKDKFYGWSISDTANQRFERGNVMRAKIRIN